MGLARKLMLWNKTTIKAYFVVLQYTRTTVEVGSLNGLQQSVVAHLEDQLAMPPRRWKFAQLCFRKHQSYVSVYNTASATAHTPLIRTAYNEIQVCIATFRSVVNSKRSRRQPPPVALFYFILLHVWDKSTADSDVSGESAYNVIRRHQLALSEQILFLITLLRLRATTDAIKGWSAPICGDFAALGVPSQLRCDCMTSWVLLRRPLYGHAGFFLLSYRQFLSSQWRYAVQPLRLILWNKYSKV